MKRLIYGSTAIKYWFPDFKRIPNDIDYICSEKNHNNINTRDVEFYYLPEFEYIFENNIDKEYVDKDFLYTIKLSHLSWDINWDKHMKDVIFLKEKGCKLIPELYNNLMIGWKRIHGDKKIKMNVKNEVFFKENIYRKYDHEWLHGQMAFYEKPLNERIRKDLDSPLCSKELWDNLTDDDKFKCALEEIYVLTCERYLFVENKKKISLKDIQFGITKILKNMIVSTTGGWFNLYLKENFNELRLFDKSHIIQVIDKINNKGV